MTNPRTSLKRLSELPSLALSAAVGAILANPMATIHGWAELLDLLGGQALRLLQRIEELLDGLAAHERPLGAVLGEQCVGLGGRAVVQRHGVAVVREVAGQVGARQLLDARERDALGLAELVAQQVRDPRALGVGQRAGIGAQRGGGAGGGRRIGSDDRSGTAAGRGLSRADRKGAGQGG